MAKIKLENVCFYSDKKQLLKSVSLVLPENQLTVIIGPSGSGKSTLLRILNGIYRLYPGQYATGQVMIDGVDILKNQIPLIELSKTVGMVLQKPTPFPMSIFQNVAFAVNIHEKISRKNLFSRVKNALQSAALWDEVKDKLREPASDLSMGQQQRLCIARVLALNPSILLLDEPCASLDPVATLEIEKTLLELKSRLTIVMVSHHVNQVKRIAEHIVFVQKGEVIANQPAATFFQEPLLPQVRSYLGAHE